MADFNWTMLGRAGVGGAITAVVGTYLVPVANAFFTFIPQTNLLISGLTPHVVVAYGTSYAIADWVNQRWLKQ